ncbi:hypothetical protein PIB30_068801 [Stylosanthes scabra]|uniref:G-patch domain-containing protein n=1 Tax=Stylosanthes scabra TaxID=79078 RepID=A0ABU6WMR4_9FABA|nr:hypothetical protein [Stylosanthes scabra]
MMIKEGYIPGNGLGKKCQGITIPPVLRENTERSGLGYIPTKSDKKQIMMDKKEKRLPRLENQEPKTTQIPIHDIRVDFHSAGWMLPDTVAVINEDLSEPRSWVYQGSLASELNNWSIVDFSTTA